MYLIEALMYFFFFFFLEFDECVLIDHGCEHNCINTLGGFECSCKPGYELHSDGKHCEGNLSRMLQQFLFPIVLVYFRNISPTID